MKKLIAIILFSLLIVPVLGSMSYSQTYTITQITHNNYDDSGARINNNGYIVWVGKPYSQEIFLYDGSSITRLTDNEYEDAKPDINDKGYVVWHGYDGQDYEIFLYDGSTVIQLTDNESYNDVDPQIDNNNNVVWHRYYTYHTCGNWDTFIYDGSSITEISTAAYCNYEPRINNHGHVVWPWCECAQFGVACMIGECGLILYDGESTKRLTASAAADPQINDNGYVVWSAGGDHEILLYDGSIITQLTDNDYDDRRPQINNNNYVVWEGPAGGTQNDEINLYDGSTITQLTDNLYSDRYPQINNNNHVVWQGDRGNGYEIFLYDGSTTIQLTDDGYNDLFPQINDNGSVVWVKSPSYASGQEIYLARPGIPNQPPTADAGNDQSVHPGDLVTLDGSASHDPDENYPLSYAWEIISKPEGSIATLDDPSVVNPTFTADLVGDYRIQLVVTDSEGLSSDPDEILVSAIIPFCEGDFDGDGDVDGSDLAVFAADFGRTDCGTGPPCEGDFDGDGVVDGSDLAIFAADFGRTDCPICP